MNHRRTMIAFQRVLGAVTDGQQMTIMAAGVETDGKRLEATIVIRAGNEAMITDQAGARAIAAALDVPQGRVAGLGGLIDDLRSAADVCDSQLAAYRGQRH